MGIEPMPTPTRDVPWNLDLAILKMQDGSRHRAAMDEWSKAIQQF